MRLDGSTALITGGSRGIGAAITRRLAADGARVLVHYGSNAEAAEETAAAVRHAGGWAETIEAQFGEGDPEAGARDLWQRVDAVVGGIDILVNNAGIADPREPIETIDSAGLHRLWTVNAATPFFVTKHGLTRITDGGRIINVSAHITQRAAPPELAAFTMTKAALETFTAALAKQLGPQGITVNAVAPGLVNTETNASWIDDAQEMVAALSPLGRVAEMSDVADVVAFLASSDSRWVTGQRLDASGGAML